MASIDTNNSKDMEFDLKQRLFVLRQLSLRDRRSKNSATVLGQLWEIFDPFLTLIIFVVLFSTMFGNRNFHNFPVYVMTGNVIYSYFTSGTTACLNALSGNKNFLIKTHIPQKLYVEEKVYVAFINFVFSMGIYAVIFLATGERFHLTTLCMIPNIVLLTFFILGIGKILAVINVGFADIRYFYQIITLAVMYASAIFYSASRLSPAAQKVLSLNPIYLSITIARLCLIDGIVPRWTLWFKLIVYTALAYGIGTYVFKKGTNDVVARL